MKISDYRRLGKISIKSRKKSTRNTVTGISFGLIMLIPIVFFTLAFYIGLTGTINETRTTSCFHVASRNVYDPAPQSAQQAETGNGYTYYRGFAINDYNSVGKLSGAEQAEETVVGELYRMAGMDNYNSYGAAMISLILDGQIYGAKNDANGVNPGGRYQPQVGLLKVLNWELSSGKWHTDAEVSDLSDRGGKVMAAGEGFTAGTKGKTEIMLSEYFLEAFGVTADAQSLVGKEVGLTVTLPAVLESGYGSYTVLDKNTAESGDLYNTTYSVPYLQNFKLVGIISKDYYALPCNTEEANVLLTSASVYTDTEDYESFRPDVSFIPTDAESVNNARTGYKVSYTNGIAATASAAANNGMMMQAFGALNFIVGSYFNTYDMTSENNLIVPALDHKIQCKNYNAATKLSKKIDVELKKIYPGADDMGGLTDKYSNDLYSNFQMINTIGGYLMLVLYAFGGIIFFATMLNLYNSVNYSVEARRNYIGVMRAIGAKEKSIPALYFFEIILIFLRALPWVLVFSGLISFGIKFGIDKAFEYVGEMLGTVISLNFAFFFVTLAVALAGVFLIALAFSQIACKNVAHKPILDVLSDDKG